MADALVDFLADVKREFMERHPITEKNTKRWGPGVWLYFDEENKNFVSYVFGWEIHRYGWRKQLIGCSIDLTPRGTNTFSVYWKRKLGDWENDEWPLKAISTRGVLNVDKCVRRLTACCLSDSTSFEHCPQKQVFIYGRHRPSCRAV